MNLLIDTHFFIWLEISLGKIDKNVLIELENPSNNIFLSLASIWEMQIKIQLGKFAFPKPLQDIVDNQKNINNLQILPILENHIYELGKLPFHHKDPFDRILIAQSLSENLVLVSDDQAFSQYSVKLLK